MDNRRVQVRDLQEAPDLKTFARQVDTYYRPEMNNVAKPGENSLMKLADALKEVEPRLQGYLSKEFDRAATDESAQGKQAFKEALLKDRDLNQRSFKELVDGGVIPAGASPWFQKGWREQQLRLMADDFQREALMEWGQDGDVKNSNDPTKVREFLDGKRKTFMDGLKTSDRGFTSHEIADVLMPALEQADQRVSGAHVSHRLQAIEEEVVKNTGIEAGRVLSAEGIDNMERGRRINATIQEMMAKGLSGSKANEIIRDELVAHALRYQDQSILDIAKHIPTQGGSFLADVGHFKKAAQGVEDHLLNQKLTAIRFLRESEAFEERKTTDAQVNTFLEHSAQAGGKIDLFDFFKRNPGLSGDAKRTIMSVHQGMTSISEHVVEDDVWMSEQLVRMYKTPETFDITEVASQVGKKLDTPRFMAMLGDLGRAREAAKHPLMTYLPVKTLADDLAKGVAGSNGTVPGAGSANAGVAQSAFLRWQIEYLAANPKTSASVFHDEAMKVYDKLLRTYGNGQTLNMGAGQAYGLKKFAPVAVDGAQQAAPQATPQARLMTLEQAIQILRKNPTPQVMQSFDESYPGHKADDYLK
ncbi:MAG: hypothetical protein FD119_2815 [Stygiobacter sp.]|nr:MAG: hypothetical protein FD119_2815 [Stygiobacter sp.]